MGWMFSRRVYLDHASATPTLPKVARAMARAALRYPGNPSAPHKEGIEAYEALTSARAAIAKTLATKPEELLFTSGGTEANNLAIQGLVEGLHQRGIPYKRMHIVTTTIEHSSVTETVRLLEQRGVRVSKVPPDKSGIVSPDAIIQEVVPDTVLVTMAHVNSEIGVIQPLSEMSIALKEKSNPAPIFRKYFPETSFPLLHADAAQSPLYLDAGPHALKADLVSYDAQKIMGPKGVGILYRDFSTPLAPIFGGGSQERGIRPGTENVPGIIGARVAFEYAHQRRKERAERVGLLRDQLIKGIKTEVPSAVLIGHLRRRTPNNACFAIPHIDGDYLAVLMDEHGVSVTPRSACIGALGNRSEVVFAVTGDDSLAHGTIRFSLGPDTKKDDIRLAISSLKICFSLASQHEGGNALRKS